MLTLPLRGAVAAALGTVVVLTGGVAASGAETTRAQWNLDEQGVNPVAVDSTGLGHTGTGAGGVVGDGSGYTFDGVDDRVVVADAHDLDPGTANFSFGVTLSMATPPANGETYDVLRKGLASTKGGNYKLEVKGVKGHARARCVVKDGTRHIAAILAPTNLEGGGLHTVRCTRTGNSVSIRIDALTPKVRTIALLESVANASNVALGAKAETTASTGFDWYKGRLNDAYISIG